MRALHLHRLALAALLPLAACGADDGSSASASAPAPTADETTRAVEAPADDAALPAGEVAPPEAESEGVSTATSPAATPADEAPPAAPEGRTVAVRVTADGFEPARIPLPVGVESRLVFTRTSDATCATSVRSPALGIAETDLPLGEAVTVRVTPARAGDLAFGCNMDMVTGAVVAQNLPPSGS
jgi:hypothetical protein